MAPPKRALIACTTYNEAFYPDGTKTGLFYSEALHPFEEFKKAGIEVDMISESGKVGLDEHSLSDDMMSADDRKHYDDKNYEMNRKLGPELKKASEVNPDDYGIFFAAGGHACLFDFPTSKTLQQIASKVYANGGVVGAVCHGPALLPGIIDQSTGKPIISGKRVTGFTDLGEEQLGLMDKIKELHAPTIESAASRVGADYSAPSEPLADYSVRDGRLVTGANPASADSAGKKCVEAYNDL